MKILNGYDEPKYIHKQLYLRRVYYSISHHPAEFFADSHILLVIILHGDKIFFKLGQNSNILPVLHKKCFIPLADVRMQRRKLMKRSFCYGLHIACGLHKVK